MSPVIRLGAWMCRSGNNVAVDLRGAELMFSWDSPPPLSPEDTFDYENEILPAVVRLAQEYLERPGRVLVVRG